MAAIEKLDLQTALRIVLGIGFGGLHAIHINGRRTTNTAHRGKEFSSGNSGDFSEQAGKVIGRQVIEHPIKTKAEIHAAVAFRHPGTNVTTSIRCRKA